MFSFYVLLELNTREYTIELGLFLRIKSQNLDRFMSLITTVYVGGYNLVKCNLDSFSLKEIS